MCAAYNQGACSNGAQHPKDLHVCSFCLVVINRLCTHQEQFCCCRQYSLAINSQPGYVWSRSAFPAVLVMFVIWILIMNKDITLDILWTMNWNTHLSSPLSHADDLSSERAHATKAKQAGLDTRAVATSVMVFPFTGTSGLTWHMASTSLSPMGTPGAPATDLPPHVVAVSLISGPQAGPSLPRPPMWRPEP